MSAKGRDQQDVQFMEPLFGFLDNQVSPDVTELYPLLCQVLGNIPYI